MSDVTEAADRLEAWADRRCEEIRFGDIRAVIAAARERDELRTQARDAHDKLVWLAVDLAWATDGRLPVAVRHAQEIVRVRTAERDGLQARLDKVREHVKLVAGWWVPGDDPRTFDQGVGAYAQDVLAILDGGPDAG